MVRGLGVPGRLTVRESTECVHVRMDHPVDMRAAVVGSGLPHRLFANRRRPVIPTVTLRITRSGDGGCGHGVLVVATPTISAGRRVGGWGSRIDVEAHRRWVDAGLLGLSLNGTVCFVCPGAGAIAGRRDVVSNVESS